MNLSLHAGLVLAGLILPGLGWTIGARWPAPVFAAGVISALAILTGTVGLALLSLPLNVGTLGAWLAIVAAGGGAFWWSRRRGATVSTAEDHAGAGWLLVAVPFLAVAVWRATVQPLSGFDVDFRWNYLAELLVQKGRLDFFPPVTAPDFIQYFWIDGFVPLISSVYTWTYLAAGSLDRHWTALPVLLQMAGLFSLVRALGAWWGGSRGGWLACGVAGATALLGFSFNLGQETGATALGAGGMVLYLAHWQRDPGSNRWVPAAGCAALAACARSYGLIFPLEGTLVLLLLGAGPWRAAGFATLALVLPAGWHLRTWVLSGNPLWSLNLAGLFPVNPVFTAFLADYREVFGQPLRHLAGWVGILRLLGTTALPALGGLAVGAWIFRGRPGWLAAGTTAAMTAATWLASVPYTSGGLIYSMRVLSPLLLLGCAWGGTALARFVSTPRRRVAVAAALAVWGLDAALRAWTLPFDPYQMEPRDWPAAGYRMQRHNTEQDWPFLRAAARQTHGKVLSESVSAQRIFRETGRELVPIWSPEVRFLFGPTGAPDAADRLRALGYSHLLLTRVQASVDFLNRTGALARLNGHLEPVMSNDTFVLFALAPAQTK